MRVALLFYAAVLGVLVAVGLALSPFGWVAEGPFLLAVVLGIAQLVRRGLALRRAAAAPADGRTCQCCTTTVFDQVEVR